jgi:hypothetical protein
LVFFVFELCKDVFSQLYDISYVNVAAQESIADLFETVFNGILVYDGSPVKLLKSSGNFSA